MDRSDFLTSSSRSRLLTVILVLYSIGAIVYLVTSFAAFEFTRKVDTGAMIDSLADVLETLELGDEVSKELTRVSVSTDLFRMLTTVLLIASLLNIGVVIGLWMGKKWALYIALGFLALTFFSSFFSGGLFFSLIFNGMVAYVFITHWSCFE